jgi:hypothetical protein
MGWPNRKRISRPLRSGPVKSKVYSLNRASLRTIRGLHFCFQRDARTPAVVKASSKVSAFRQTAGFGLRTFHDRRGRKGPTMSVAPALGLSKQKVPELGAELVSFSCPLEALGSAGRLSATRTKRTTNDDRRSSRSAYPRQNVRFRRATDFVFYSHLAASRRRHGSAYDHGVDGLARVWAFQAS